MDLLPRELLITICGVIENGATFKAWRLVCNDFYRSSANWPGRTGRFANDLIQLILRFPAANWDWPRLSFSEYIPFSFIEAFPDLPWTKEIADHVISNEPRAQIYWRRFYEIRPDTLIGCLRFSPDCEEFIGVAIARYGEERCFEALAMNDHLTQQFVVDHPSEKWDDRLYDLYSDDINVVIKFSKVIDWEYASYKIALKDIAEHPELPWVADVVAERDPDPLPCNFEDIDCMSYTYEYVLANVETLGVGEVVGGDCRVPVEYVLRHHLDLSEFAMWCMSQTVDVFEIFAHQYDQQGNKIAWEMKYVMQNYCITWQLVVDHPEIDWRFDMMSGRHWNKRW